MDRRKRWFNVLVFAIFACFFLSMIPSYGEICQVDEKTKKEECTRYHFALVDAWHTAKFFDDHNGAVTALFTIVLAISTIGLWSATKKLYDAGERQLEITREAAERQSLETALSLKLTEESVKAANLSAEAAKGRSQLLAWVSLIWSELSRRGTDQHPKMYCASN